MSSTDGADSRIVALRVRAVNVPLSRPLATAGGSLEGAPLLLFDLTTNAGAIGRSYLFCYSPLVQSALVALCQQLETVLIGSSARADALWALLVARFRLLGSQGLLGMALAGIDMASWDAMARADEVPLYTLLGGTSRPIPAYNSNGLGLSGVPSVAEEASVLLGEGINALKVRLGYPTLAEDLEVLDAVRGAVDTDTRLMVDYNQSLGMKEAIRRSQSMDDYALEWIEEPVLAEGFKSSAAVAAAVDTPVQSGENLWGVLEMEKLLDLKASDLFMADAAKIGGVSGFVDAAALAEQRSVPLSSHLYPEFSAHLLAATSTAHWIEYVDWANPVLIHPVRVKDGCIVPSDTLGAGIEWDEAVVDRYAV